jgi:hypothetical protein
MFRFWLFLAVSHTPLVNYSIRGILRPMSALLAWMKVYLGLERPELR